MRFSRVDSRRLHSSRSAARERANREAEQHSANCEKRRERKSAKVYFFVCFWSLRVGELLSLRQIKKKETARDS